MLNALCLCSIFSGYTVCTRGCNTAPFSVSSTAHSRQKRSGCPGEPAAHAPRARLPTVDGAPDWTTITDHPAEKMMGRQKPQSHSCSTQQTHTVAPGRILSKDPVHMWLYKMLHFQIEILLLHMWTYSNLSWWFLTLNGLKIPWSRISWNREFVQLWRILSLGILQQLEFCTYVSCSDLESWPNQTTKDGVSCCRALTGIMPCG